MPGLSSTIVRASCRVRFHGEDPSDFTACKQSDDIQLREAFEELPGERDKVYEQGGPLRHTRDNVGFVLTRSNADPKIVRILVSITAVSKNRKRAASDGKGTGCVLTLFLLTLTKGIFACRRLTESSLCTVEK